MVTERLSFTSMVEAMDHIYNRDLPVFLSSDAILEALHRSYDLILQYLEKEILIPNLKESLSLMRNGISELKDKYGDNPGLNDALIDADLYVTIAKSLIDHLTYNPLIASQGIIDKVLIAIYDEGYIEIPLFSERDRLLDFSQFKPRGHYINEWNKDEFEEYFRTMMWLGRIDFFLTPPPVVGEPEWTKEEIRRMHLASFMLQELLETSGAGDILRENDRIIEFMVGESDNLTPRSTQKLLMKSPTLSARISYYQIISTIPIIKKYLLPWLPNKRSFQACSNRIPLILNPLSSRYLTGCSDKGL